MDQDSESVDFRPVSLYETRLTLTSIQIDNQMFDEREIYDFPVILKSVEKSFDEREALEIIGSVSSFGELVSVRVNFGTYQAFLEDKLDRQSHYRAAAYEEHYNFRNPFLSVRKEFEYYGALYR